MKYAIAIDIGGMFIKASSVNTKAKVLNSLTLKTRKEKGLREVVKNIELIIKSLKLSTKGEPVGIGVGVPGIVDGKKNQIQFLPNFWGWKQVDLGKVLKKKFRLPVYMDNDANLAAVGEKFCGSGKEQNNFVLLTLGTGIGGGIYLDGKLWHGVNYKGAELGHIKIASKSEKCGCGSYGCFEQFASATAFSKNIRNFLIF